MSTIGTGPLYCEQGCGQEQEISMADIGLCGDCAAEIFRHVLKSVLGYRPCGKLVKSTGLHFICIEARETEHDHGSLN